MTTDTKSTTRCDGSGAVYPSNHPAVATTPTADGGIAPTVCPACLRAIRAMPHPSAPTHLRMFPRHNRALLAKGGR
jgi:hypothetical protein